MQLTRDEKKITVVWLRQEFKLTQTQIGELIGCRQSTVHQFIKEWKLEHGNKKAIPSTEVRQYFMNATIRGTKDDIDGDLVQWMGELKRIAESDQKEYVDHLWDKVNTFVPKYLTIALSANGDHYVPTKLLLALIGKQDD